MIDWLRRLFGHSSVRKERRVKKIENNVDRLEDQAVVQQERLDAATKRVNAAVAQVKRVEALARKPQ